MNDKSKIILLVVISIVVMALFIGVGLTADNYEYFLSRRVPKVLAIIIAGIALAQSSLAFQTITHNRILTPSVMGFDFLYQFIQIFIVMVFGGLSSFVVNVYWNFTLSSVVMLGFSFLLFTFYFRKGKGNLITLLLLGVVIGQVFNNMANFMVMLMDPNDFASAQANLFASFNNANVSLVYTVTPLLLLVSFVLYRMHRTLDVFWLDHDNATSLGVDVAKVTRNTLLLSAILISISTALVGPILFFGILVTNLTREWFRTYRHSVLLTGCSAMAVCALLSGQWVIEKFLNFETTLSVVINFIGGIYFLTLLVRNKVV
ncbi:iron chelate uptake ABC transporter permease subunit VctG [Vibrio sp.]|nr:iron chelate uptake ABC transporter permease subunit VctG [Vibrio sp.]